MRRIPFIHARFYDLDPVTTDSRLRAFLLKFRNRRMARQLISDDGAFGVVDLDSFAESMMQGVDLTSHDVHKIARRTARLMQRRTRSSAFAHLKREEIKRLEVLRDGVDLIQVRTEAQADEWAATLHEEMPWMAEATEVAWNALRRSARAGEPGVRIPPLLLNGPAGIGKSVWARRLAEILGTPACVVEAGGAGAGFGVAGLQRGWGNAGAGRPLEVILQTLVGNPVVIIDEIDKAGSAASASGQAFGLSEAMLALLEPATNRNWECPYFRVRFDMSWISWVLTSNEIQGISVPLRDRCRVIDLPPISYDQICIFVRREAERLGLSEASADAIVVAMMQPAARGKPLSLRGAIRMLERAEVMEARPLSH